MSRLTTPLAALLLLAAPAAHAATYDLRAAASTLAVPGIAAPVPVWGFADETGLTPGTGAVSVPGPVLRANPGETLTLNVRNDLPVPISIVIPGQPFAPPPAPIHEGGRVRSFAAEVAAGGAGTYTFTALREGTFLYQSGTHVGVQLPMGLYGALVVGAAPGGIPEQVLVWSEIDPEVNRAVAAAPLEGHSTARFKPARYLVNGKAYPDQAPLALVAGADAYLRFVNAGSALHMPAFTGFPLAVQREDGATLAHGYDTDVLRLTPGMAVEAVARPPAAGRSVLYDRRLHTRGAGGATLVVDATGANAAPAVTAGPDLVAVISDGAIALQGSATDGDGPGALATSWRQVSGPAAATFIDPASPTTLVSFAVEGTYVLELAASDGLSTATDRMALTVGPAAPPSDPADVLATRLGTSSIYLVWRDTSTSATSFVIERRDASGGAASAFVELATVSTPIVELLDEAAAMGAADHEWQYRVRAVNGVGSSASVESAWLR